MPFCAIILSAAHHPFMSRNRLALAQGTITLVQFVSMAVYKFVTYDNAEDLDPWADYSDYGVVQCYPVVTIVPHNNRTITSPRGLARCVMDKLNAPHYDFDVDTNDVDFVEFANTAVGWVWCHIEWHAQRRVEQCIKYCYGGWVGTPHPVSQLVTGTCDAW